MKKIITILASALLIVACSGENNNYEISSNENERIFIEGEHYEKMDNYISYASSDFNIEKFFWIGCEHCQNMEKIINSYELDHEHINIKRVHAPLAERWIFDSRIYYALIEKNSDMFNDLIYFYENYRLNNNGLPDIEAIGDFLELNGIDKIDFFEYADSDVVNDKIISVRENMIKNKITSVPTVVINGRYKLSHNLPSDIQTQEDFNALINYLINKKEKNEK